MDLCKRNPEWQAKYVIFAEYPLKNDKSYIYNDETISKKLENAHILVIDIMPIVFPMRNCDWQKEILQIFEPYIEQKLIKWERILQDKPKFYVAYQFLYHIIEESMKDRKKYAGISLAEILPPEKSERKRLAYSIGNILGKKF
jgi:hypothetical protein